MNHAVGRRVWIALLAGVVALAAIILLNWTGQAGGLSGQPGLSTADPPPNALLAAAPDQIALTFAAPINPESASVRLLGAGGAETALEIASDAPEDARRIVARPTGPLTDSAYMVLWSARSAVDDALLAGAYPFRAGLAGNPGAARIENQWPSPWATMLRWLVFVGTALAVGGFGWSRLPASVASIGPRAPLSLVRGAAMTAGALLALLATLVSPPLHFLLTPAADRGSLEGVSRAMSTGWWLQLSALVVLSLLCMGALANRRATRGLPPAHAWLGLAAGLVALLGLSLTSHAAAIDDRAMLALEVVHQWSTALWFGGLLYLVGAWRDFGTDVARFRAVRWIGGVLIAISVVTGVARAWPFVPSVTAVLSTRYGQVLAGKSVLVLIIVVLGVLALVVPRRSNANRASGSLGLQSALGFAAALLAALLAMLAPPGSIVLATLAATDLVAVASLDAKSFGEDQGMIHLITQPGGDGRQTVVVRLTDAGGAPLAPDPVPAVQITWTPMTTSESPAVIVDLQPGPAGAVFSGTADLPAEGWWEAAVVVAPPGGITTRARFWLVLPDPNVTGRGPDPASEPAARELFERGLTSLTSLRSVRVARALNDGAGALVRTRSAVSAGDAEQPPMSRETVIDGAGAIASEQRTIGDRRWILEDGQGWIEAEPGPLLTPADWGAAYAGATGFQLGPRESLDGEISQIVTFWQPSGENLSRAPAWFTWWIGLASGEVRREVMISTGHYQVSDYSDFAAPLSISPPMTPSPAATPAADLATPNATPAATPVAARSS